jgi:HK97 family phage prohead protease
MPQAQNLLYKSVNATGIKTIDEEQGIVECFVAGIGNKDSVGEIIEKGAFVDSIGKRSPKGVWSHDWDRPVSKTLDIHEVNAGDDRLPKKMKDAGIGGLYVKTQFNLETQDGRDALSWVKFYGEESEWSIGYTAQAEYDKKAKATRLKKIELYEYSPVLFGANPLTSTVGVKVHFGADDDGNITVDVYGVDDEAIQDAARKAVMDVIAKTEDTPKEDLEFEIDGVEPEMSEKIEAAIIDADTSEAEKVELEETDAIKEASEDIGDKSAKDDDEEAKTVEKEKADSVEETQADGSEEKSDDADLDKKNDEEVDTPEEESLFVQGVKNFLTNAQLTAEESHSLKSFIDERSEKAGLPGSFEERQCDLRNALEAAHDSWNVYIIATFESNVVYEVYSRVAGEYSTYERGYNASDDGISLGEAVEVDIVPVVVAKAAIIEAVFKGYGPQVSSILAPLIEGATTDTPDADVKSALEEVASKAGASLSQKNRGHLQTALTAIQNVLGVEEDTDEKTVEAEAKTADIETDIKPWHVEKQNSKFCVIKDSDGSKVSCHGTMKEANEHMAALYASEDKSLVEGEKSNEEEVEKVALSAEEYKSLMEIITEDD